VKQSIVQTQHKSFQEKGTSFTRAIEVFELERCLVMFNGQKTFFMSPELALKSHPKRLPIERHELKILFIYITL